MSSRRGIIVDVLTQTTGFAVANELFDGEGNLAFCRIDADDFSFVDFADFDDLIGFIDAIAAIASILKASDVLRGGCSAVAASASRSRFSC